MAVLRRIETGLSKNIKDGKKKLTVGSRNDLFCFSRWKQAAAFKACRVNKEVSLCE